MTDYNFILIDNNKFNIDHPKLMNIYSNIKNKKNLIKPIRKKINSVNITNLSHNITKFNNIINKIYNSIDKKKPQKVKKIIKKTFNTKNYLQNEITYEIIKNIKQNYNNQKGGYIILDFLGLIPILGLPIDILNGILSLSSGNYFDALLSFAAAVPAVGTLPGLGKIGFKIFKKMFGFTSILDTVLSFMPSIDQDEDEDEDEDENENENEDY